MYADNNQSFVLVLFIPRVEIGSSALTVDTTVCPEIDQHNFLADKFTDGDWFAVSVDKIIGSRNFLC